jgi:hypothetical protein
MKVLNMKGGMGGECKNGARVENTNKAFSFNKLFTTGEDKRVFAACIAKPEHEDFTGILTGAYQAIDDALKTTRFKENELHHRRGDFAQVTTGVSYGVGRKAATNLKHKGHDKIIAEILKDKNIQRLAQFSSGELERGTVISLY